MAFPIERRMAVLMGPGKTRYLIADVNIETQTIHHRVNSGVFSTNFYIDLLRNDGAFSDLLIEHTQDVFKKIKQKYEYYNVTRYKIVATHSLRRAKNNKTLLNSLQKKYDLNVHVLTTEEEDAMDYFSAVKGSDHLAETMVWDISSDFFQVIVKKENGSFLSYKAHFGSVNFMDYFLASIQKKPHLENRDIFPIQQSEVDRGIRFAQMLISKVPDAMKPQVKVGEEPADKSKKHTDPKASEVTETSNTQSNQNTTEVSPVHQRSVQTVGSLFLYSIGKAIAGRSDTVSKDMIKLYLDVKLAGEADDWAISQATLNVWHSIRQLGAGISSLWSNDEGFIDGVSDLMRPEEDTEEDAFVSINVANAMMVYGFMEELGVNEIILPTENPVEGILEYPLFWE